MWFVYILRSTSTGRHYIGSCRDHGVRLQQHNAGSVRSTKGYRPWVLVYSEAMMSVTEARRRELQIKSYKGGEAFKKLVSV